jgi:hypothetical protein
VPSVPSASAACTAEESKEIKDHLGSRLRRRIHIGAPCAPASEACSLAPDKTVKDVAAPKLQQLRAADASPLKHSHFRAENYYYGMVVVLPARYGVSRSPMGENVERGKRLTITMMGREAYSGSNFRRDPCPICGEMFSRCGMPNHIRRHSKAGVRKKESAVRNRRSAAWWDGWKEGYKVGMRDGANELRRKILGRRE